MLSPPLFLVLIYLFLRLSSYSTPGLIPSIISSASATRREASSKCYASLTLLNSMALLSNLSSSSNSCISNSINCYDVAGLCLRIFANSVPQSVNYVQSSKCEYVWSKNLIQSQSVYYASFAYSSLFPSKVGVPLGSSL